LFINLIYNIKVGALTRIDCRLYSDLVFLKEMEMAREEKDDIENIGTFTEVVSLFSFKRLVGCI
jgi:hypothetical protein